MAARNENGSGGVSGAVVSEGLPDNLPSIANARLPSTYEAAKTAIAECARIDECADWANKAEAMAAYARMSEDDSLRKKCDRIQARATRRCGELLGEFDGRGRPSENSTGSDTISQREAAANAGMSKRQQVTAGRVANVPEADFDAQVESDDPPTVTALAEQGKKTRNLVDLEGRDPEEYSLATTAQSMLRHFAVFAAKTDPAAVARGSKTHEIIEIQEHIASVNIWLDVLASHLEE